MARTILFGTSVSPGISIGKIRFLHIAGSVEERFVLPGETESEVERLHAAAKAASEELAHAEADVPDDLAEQREIIHSHMLICQDPKLLKEAAKRIREQCVVAEWALEQTVNALCEVFRTMEDAYLRDRAQDIRTVGLRVRAHLSGAGGMTAEKTPPCIHVAEDLSPADTLGLKVDRILALIMAEGGPTSHTAILARSLRIPAVVGVTGILEDARDGDFAIVDALRGCIYIDPDEKELATFARRQEEYIAWEWKVRRNAYLAAETQDGVRVDVQANIENPGEIGSVNACGAEGVGLYRTEFAYIKGKELPDEEQLYAEYAAVAQALSPRRVVFRTLDVGADKMLHTQMALKEPNPALGLRAIRFCLRHQNILRTQLRALLRAGLSGNLALMLPMISGPGEVQSVRRIISEVSQELAAQGVPHQADVPVGIMIEVPSAVFMADALARECDFFSIGTNDLIHYMLAIDRGNKHVAYLHEPLHLSVVRSLKRIIDCAHREGIGVSVCGELAADPYCLAILLGMGVDALSATPQSVPGIKHLVRNLNAATCTELAHSVLMTSDVAAANRMVTETLGFSLHEELAFHTTMLPT